MLQNDKEKKTRNKGIRFLYEKASDFDINLNNIGENTIFQSNLMNINHLDGIDSRLSFFFYVIYGLLFTLKMFLFHLEESREIDDRRNSSIKLFIPFKKY